MSDTEKYNIVRRDLLVLNAGERTTIGRIQVVSTEAEEMVAAAGGTDASLDFRSMIGGDIIMALQYSIEKTSEEVVSTVLARATTVEARRATFDALKLEFEPELVKAKTK